MPDFTQTCQKIYRNALLHAPEYQPWEGYYLVRAVESEIIAHLLGLKNDYTMLEIGCGNGFYSALFSPHVRKIYSGDLEAPNSSTHTMGIARAKELLNKLDVPNVAVASFSGTELPFGNETFHLVFTASTLEHISDREKAIAEIKRVLKPGGRAVIIVPNFTTSIYSVFHLPLYLGMAVLRRAFRRKIKCNCQEDLLENPQEISVSARLGEVLRLKPHGEYRNLWDELCSSYPSKWEKLFQDAGMQVLASRGTIILPWSLISVFSSRFGSWLYKITKGFHKRIVARYAFFKYFSYLLCIVVTK